LNNNGKIIGYLLTQYKPTQKEFENALKILKTLNDDGFTQEEAKKRLEDAKKTANVFEKSKL
jgi:hypothetical protein